MIVEFLKHTSKQYQFLTRNNTSLFFQKTWINIYGNNLKLCGLFTEKKQLFGGFVLYSFKRLGARALITPPMMPDINLYYKNELSNDAKKNSFNKKVMRAIVDFSIKNADFIELRFSPFYKDFQPFIWNNFQLTHHYTYQIFLNKNIQEIRSSYHPDRRNKLQKEHLKSLVVKIEDLPANNQEINFLFSRFNYKKVNYKKEIIKKILTSKTITKIKLTAFLSSEIQAFIFLVLDNNIAYYLLGASLDNSSQSWSYLMDKAIEESKVLGMDIFDFEGSMLPDIERNFREFGGELFSRVVVSKRKGIQKLVKYLLK